MVTLMALGPSIVTGPVTLIWLANVIVRGTLKKDEKSIRSAPPLALASSTACRSDPVPESASLRTVKFAGARRHSKSSHRGRAAWGLRRRWVMVDASSRQQRKHANAELPEVRIIDHPVAVEIKGGEEPGLTRVQIER